MNQNSKYRIYLPKLIERNRGHIQPQYDTHKIEIWAEAISTNRHSNHLMKYIKHANTKSVMQGLYVE